MLSDLPTELTEHITGYLDVNTFRSFRLVSHSLNQQSLHQFRQRFFRTRTVAWTTESLDKLTHITSDLYFGKCLRDLIIDATPRFAIRLWELEKGIIEADLQQDQARRNDVQVRYSEVEARFEHSKRFWNETRHDRKALTAVFEHLGRLQSIVFAYDGMKKNFLLFGRRYCESSQNEMSRPFVSTMAAVAKSKLIVQTISVDPTRRYGAVSTGRLESLSPLLVVFDDIFLGLKGLKMSIRDWRSPDDGFEMPTGKASFLVRFLAKLRNLESLDLSCFSSLEENVLSEMARHCKYPRLRTCRLHLFRVPDTKDLLHFLEPAHAWLQSLTLCHCIVRDGEWSQVMIDIATELRLGHVELSDLFTRSGARVGFDGTMRRTLVLEGPDIENQLIFQSGRLISGNWGPAWHLAAVAYPFIGLHT
ncbi:Protein-lysine N-methyltransferase efm4 [Didymosphaeria variabile]|uniref:Protein-lysine N-methyltransferase efm4 n=1 Tax=Didymosphaeria variabile TaxID=1932322 RepID=A0A9W8XGR4_9PLEO|nr:Protein-lysine N-methyltransferase efm4 [Didymosphaeria variabile]KAJ4350351.1 Protein-lysine N-methyltransferase efm4 [Didymosphaeria variabile]